MAQQIASAQEDKRLIASLQARVASAQDKAVGRKHSENGDCPVHEASREPAAAVMSEPEGSLEQPPTSSEQPSMQRVTALEAELRECRAQLVAAEAAQNGRAPLDGDSFSRLQFQAEARAAAEQAGLHTHVMELQQQLAVARSELSVASRHQVAPATD